MRRLLKPLLAFVLGMFTVLGFAPFYFFPIPILTLAGLFHLWLHAPSRRAAMLLGFAFGFGMFGAGASWVYVSMHDFGAMPAPLAVAATMLFCAVLALFPALAGLLQQLLGRGPSAWKAGLIIPAAWVVGEWVRGWVLTGFPWLATGYSQVPASPLAGFAPVLGVYGVSLAVAASAGLLALGVEGGRGKGGGASSFILHPSAFIFLALWLGGFALQQVEWTRPAGAPVAVSLVQGNIPQEMKWRPDKVRGTLSAYERLARESAGRLVVLPETALPMFYDEVPPGYLESLAETARARGGDLIVGIPEYRALDKGGEYFNSAFSFGAAPPQIYRKSHLVPFGEYIPLKPMFGWVLNVLHIPLADFSRGAAVQQPMDVAGQKLAVDICYEDVFGEEIIRQLPQATMLANLSNDAWFGRSFGPPQHLQIAQARALETGRWLLRATNTGVTAIIDQKGEVVRQAPQFVVAVLEGEAQGFAGETPYVRFGNGAVLVLAGLMLALGVIAARSKLSPLKKGE